MAQISNGEHGKQKRARTDAVCEDEPLGRRVPAPVLRVEPARIRDLYRGGNVGECTGEAVPALTLQRTQA